jgi:transcriptional regulator with XRE-family HTH domain
VKRTQVTASNRLSVGERIELHRLHRGLSRAVVAGLVGRSPEWLRLVEHGTQPLDSVSATVRLAQVLEIDDLGELIDWPQRPLRPALTAADTLVGDLRRAVVSDLFPAGAADRRSADAVRGEIRQCTLDWNHSPRRYTTLLHTLPALLPACRENYRRSGGSADGETLIAAYHLCRRISSRVGAHELAWLVADRSLGIVAPQDSPLPTAAARWHIAAALLHLHDFTGSHDYACAAAAHLADRAPDHPARWVLSGALHSVAARAAEANGDVAEADRLIAPARAAAERIGRDLVAEGIGYGPTEFAVTQMELASAREDHDRVVAVATGLDIADDHPMSSRVRCHILSAGAYARRNEDVAAVFALNRAAEICPDDLRFDPDAHLTLQRLLRRGNRLAGRDIARLAHVAGLL